MGVSSIVFFTVEAAAFEAFSTRAYALIVINC